VKAAWWWIDRWRKSTAYTDMTLAEQGAYRTLLDELWLRGGLLPLDERILAKASGDAVEWPQVRDRVLSRFRKIDQGYRNDTHDEIQAESSKRAERQKRYRNDRRNGSGNVTSNVAPSPSPSPSLRNNGPIRQASAREGTPTKANPFIAGERPKYETEALRLTREISDLTGEDPVEVFQHAAHYKGAERSKVNPAAMSDDRLLNTVLDLRATLATTKAKPQQKAGA